jgi:probable F420-dependent oxidoreductase
VKLDLSLPTRSGPDVRDAAVRAEGAGYDGVWTTEITHDPFVGAALAAVVTSTVDVGTAVAIAFARNPMSVAMQAADLHQLSSGRFVLGLGTQVRAHVTRRYGMPWSRPAARLHEFVRAVRAVWAAWYDGVPLDFEGEFYQHTLLTPFFTPEPSPYGVPPILVAAVGERMCRVAGQVADGVLCHSLTSVSYLREVMLPAARAGRADAGAGGAFEVGLAPLVAVGADDAELAAAVRGVRHQLAFYASTPAYSRVLEYHGHAELAERLSRAAREQRWREQAHLIDDELLTTFAVVGKPAAAGRELVRRFGGLATRITPYLPYRVADSTAAELRAAICGSLAG